MAGSSRTTRLQRAGVPPRRSAVVGVFPSAMYSTLSGFRLCCCWQGTRLSHSGRHEMALRAQARRAVRRRRQGRGCQPSQESSATSSTSVATGAVGSVTSTTVIIPSSRGAEDVAAIRRPAPDIERDVERDDLARGHVVERRHCAHRPPAREGDRRTVGGPVRLELVRRRAGDEHVFSSGQVHEIDVLHLSADRDGHGRSIGGDGDVLEGSAVTGQVADPLDVRAIGVHPIDAVVGPGTCQPSRRR